MPNYNYRRRNDIAFINPYTFIPVSGKQPIKRKSLEPADSDKLHTGVLRCRLYVRTPLGIPDAEKEKEDGNGHKEYPFFSYEENGKNVPVIPGSSLRGVIRSVFEAATDSCFSTLRENTGLSKRIEYKNAYKPGILKWENENGNWQLYRAERYLLAVEPGRNDYTKYDGLPPEAYVHMITKGRSGTRIAVTSAGVELRFGDLVDFRPTGGAYRKENHLIWNGAAGNINKKKPGNACGAGMKEGLVYIGETFGRKKHGESIFTFGAKETELAGEQLNKAYEGMLETLAIYRNPAINRSKGHSGYIDFEHAKKEAGIPVWYSAEEKKLSLASIGRTFYNTSLNDLTGERNPCVNRNELCEACALFGMAGDEGLGSRVRFTDGRVQNSCTIKKETLKILGQPRYSYLPFYAKANGRRIPGSYDEEGVEIAGRKFYWHNPKAATDKTIYTIEKKSKEEKSKMNSTMELVMPGAEFCFDIYYDGITEEQLSKLMWSVHFGENKENGRLCHKLGHGKPLGLGSVKAVIEEKVERIFKEGSYRWKREKMPGIGAEPALKRARELKKVMDFRGLDENIPIKYPYICDRTGRDLSESGRNEEARHVWYLKNKKTGRNNGDSMEILPDVLDGNQKLHPYEKEQEGNYPHNYRNNGTGRKR